MAKETYRTIKKLWLFNYCTIIIILILHLSNSLAAETENEIKQNVTLMENNTLQQPVAEPLVRYRRQPPRTIVKHLIRPKRFKMKRIKRPKIKYSFAEPPPTYYARKPVTIKKPTFDSSIFEGFAHVNMESADFDLAPSSYEAQSMDLDLYKHYESTNEASYKDIQKPSTYSYTAPEASYKEPLYTEVRKGPKYSYTVPEVSIKETVTYSYTPRENSPRKPHTNYGVPTEYVYSTGYDKPNNDNSHYSFEKPSSKPVYSQPEKAFYNAHGKNEYKVPRIPATTYGVPDAHIPLSGSNDYNKYSLIEHKPNYETLTPTKPETYHFAEPPQPEPSVEITYSPSYEINIPTSHENAYSKGNYNVEHQPLPPPSYEKHPKYEQPPQQNYAEENYETSNTYESPPASYQESSDTNHQPASYQPAPAQHENIAEYIPTSEDLPISVNHKQPTYDYPKSSYEVPIYDPIPFDSSNNQEHEIYPPQSYEHANSKSPFPIQQDNVAEQRPEQSEKITNDVHSSGTQPKSTLRKPQSPITRLRRTRKRKRTNTSSTTISTTKHILDVPELKEAFEKENRKKFENSQEPDTNESQKVLSINHNAQWNPMKIRTSPITSTTPTSTSVFSTLPTKHRRYQYKQQRSTTTTTTIEPPTKIDIISIEKSRSKTLYDGVVATPKIHRANYFRNRHKLEDPTTSTPRMQPSNELKYTRRTTKNVFDTTIFKSPINDREAYHNLPKNHKLF